MEQYHKVWLEAHPNRTRQWLIDRLKDGFQVHHLDGDHKNDNPKNLALIEGMDHMQMHGIPLGQQLKLRVNSSRKRTKKRGRNSEAWKNYIINRPGKTRQKVKKLDPEAVLLD